MDYNGSNLPMASEVNGVLNDIGANAIKIYQMLNKCMPDNEEEESWWEWEHETIKKFLFNEYSIAINDACWEKIMTIKTICNSNACMFDWYDFNQVTISLTGHKANFNCLKTPSPGMIISAIKSIVEIRDDIIKENIEYLQSDTHIFSIDVVNYICKILEHEGIYAPPPSIAIYIIDEMRKMVKEETLKSWPDILERYKEFESNNFEKDEPDNSNCIQARRILRAELAAQTF